MLLVSDIGLKVLKEREGVRLKAYKDSVGVWTIGWGHTAGVKPGDQISRATAEAYLAADIDSHAAPILAAVTVPLTQNEADALVSIAFNIGIGGFKKSTFLRLLNAGNKAGCAEAILKWDKPPEIRTRRAAERMQFLTPYTVALPVATLKSGAAPARRLSVPATRARAWAEEDLAEFEVRAIQQRLRDLGFFQVGKVDGKIGPSFKAGLLALQATAGITEDGHWGPETKAALADDANKRKIEPARANTTAADLRHQGSTIAIEANRITWASSLGMLGALAAAAYQAYNAPAELPFGSSILLGILPPPVGAILSAAGPFLLAFIPLAYTALSGKGIERARVVAEQTGLHNGEPAPAQTDEDEPSDSPKLGGLLGTLFGRR